MIRLEIFWILDFVCNINIMEGSDNANIIIAVIGSPMT